MKRPIICIAIVLSSMLMTSCSTFLGTPTDSGLAKVEKGMSKKEVIGLLGNPLARSFNDDLEDLTYEKPFNYTTHQTSLIHIILKNDQVVSMETEILPCPPPQPIVKKE